MTSFSWIDLTGDGTRLVPLPVELSHDPAAQAAYFAGFDLTTPPPAPHAPDAPAPAADEESPP